MKHFDKNVPLLLKQQHLSQSVDVLSLLLPQEAVKELFRYYIIYVYGFIEEFSEAIGGESDYGHSMVRAVLRQSDDSHITITNRFDLGHQACHQNVRYTSFQEELSPCKRKLERLERRLKRHVL